MAAYSFFLLVMAGLVYVGETALAVLYISAVAVGLCLYVIRIRYMQWVEIRFQEPPTVRATVLSTDETASSYVCIRPNTQMF